MHLFTRSFVPSALLALTIAACTTNATSAAPATSAAAATTAAATTSAAAASGDTVTLKGFTFSPANLTVKKGTTVTFVNMDSVTHTVTSGSGGTKDGKFDQSIDGSGGAAKITFDTVGTFAYFCTIHQSMKGTITVQ